MKYTDKSQTGGSYGGCCFIVIPFIIIVICIIQSCAKHSVIPSEKLDRYARVEDWYSLDTSKHLNRITWLYDSVYSKQIICEFENKKDVWLPDCLNADQLQHIYYLKNGVKIQPSNWPKQ